MTSLQLKYCAHAIMQRGVRAFLRSRGTHRKEKRTFELEVLRTPLTFGKMCVHGAHLGVGQLVIEVVPQAPNGLLAVEGRRSARINECRHASLLPAALLKV
jgi:hypothetical protein